MCIRDRAEAADITGKWYASLFGISVTMSLNEDGSYVLQMDMEDEEPSEGTWEFDGAALVMDKSSDTEMTLTYDPEAVSFCAEQDGIEFLFTREMPVAFEAAPVRADAAIEEFAGAWTCTLIDAMGIQAPPEMMDMYAGVTIEGSSVTLAIPDLLSSEAVSYTHLQQKRGQPLVKALPHDLLHEPHDLGEPGGHDLIGKIGYRGGFLHDALIYFCRDDP